MSRQVPVPLIEETWRYAGRIKLTRPVREAHALSAQTEVAVVDKQVRVESGEIHETVLVSY
jgi:hypothetical protein